MCPSYVGVSGSIWKFPRAVFRAVTLYGRQSQRSPSYDTTSDILNRLSVVGDHTPPRILNSNLLLYHEIARPKAASLRRVRNKPYRVKTLNTRFDNHCSKTEPSPHDLRKRLISRPTQSFLTQDSRECFAFVHQRSLPQKRAHTKTAFPQTWLKNIFTHYVDLTPRRTDQVVSTKTTTRLALHSHSHSKSQQTITQTRGTKTPTYVKQRTSHFHGHSAARGKEKGVEERGSNLLNPT